MTETIVFTKSTSEENRHRALEYIKSLQKPYSEDLQEAKGIIYKSEFSESEAQEIDRQLSIAKRKLEALGINPNLIPGKEALFYYQSTDEEAQEIGAVTGDFNEAIHIEYPVGMSLGDQDVQRALFHELSHFITKTSVRVGETYRSYSPEELAGAYMETVGTGFERNTSKLMGSRGMFEEGVSDIFTAYCMESDIESVYNVQTPFIVALVKDISVRSGVSEAQTFTEIFSAKVGQDFGFMKRLVDVYGSEFVRELNNNELVWATASKEYVQHLAKLGGFETQLKETMESFDSGNSISIEGLAGSIHKAKFEAERS